jgi:hypothetical protein
MAEIAADVLGIVAHDVSATNINACRYQHLRHAAGVRIDNLPNKQLVAYIQYRRFHAAKVRIFLLIA